MLARLGIVHGTPESKAIWRTANAMAASHSLPSKQDEETADGLFITRKAMGWRLWVWTMNDGVLLTVVTITDQQPTPEAPPPSPPPRDRPSGTRLRSRPSGPSSQPTPPRDRPSGTRLRSARSPSKARRRSR